MCTSRNAAQSRDLGPARERPPASAQRSHHHLVESSAMLTATLSAMLAADEAEAEARPDTLDNQAPYTADAASAQTYIDGISELTAAPGHAPRTLGAEEALQQIVNNYAAAQPGCIESIAAPLPSAALLPAAALPLPLTTVPTAPDAENVPEQAEPSSVKRRWTDEEDKQLLQAVALYGAQRWPLIASALSSMREGKQCRERWFNHLCPDVKKGEWTAEEDELMAQAVAELGTKWCEIGKRLPGRTDNAIKNRYNSQLRKSKRRSDASAVAVAAAAAAEQQQQQQQQQPLDDAVAASRPGAKRRRANAAKADGTVEEVEQDAAKPKSAGAVVASEGSCASASEAPVPEAPVAVVSAAAAAAASALALCAQVGSMVAVQAAELEADQQEGEEVEEAEQGDDDALSQASDEVVEALEVEATIELEVQAAEATKS